MRRSSPKLRIFRYVASATYLFYFRGIIMKLIDLYECFSAPLFLVVLFIAAYFALIDLKIFVTSSVKKSEPDNLATDILQVHLSFKTAKIIVTIIDLILAATVLIGSSQFWILCGSQDIRVMPSGTYCYYVYATNEKDKTYTLPAEVEKINNDTYLVYNVYFKNGGYLYFDDCDYFDYGDSEYVIDQNGNGWHIKLTNNKTTHTKVYESYKPSNILLTFAAFIIFLLSAIFHTIHLIRYHKKHIYV